MLVRWDPAQRYDGGKYSERNKAKLAQIRFSSEQEYRHHIISVHHVMRQCKESVQVSEEVNIVRLKEKEKISG